MYIVIDTNAVNTDLRLINSGIIKLASKAKLNGYELCFPQVVVEEMIKHYKENINSALKAIQKSDKIIQDNTGVSVINAVKQNMIEKSLNKYRNELRARIMALNGKMLGSPSKEQQGEILKKAVLRGKPFKSNGIGYPDALIWGNIMDLAERYSDHPVIMKPRIIFVSNNHTDFCKSDKFDLHDELIKELADASVSKQTVIVVKSLDDASRLLKTHSDAIITEEATALFLASEHKTSKLKLGVERKILSALPFKAMDNHEIGLSNDLEEPTIDMINEDYTYKDITTEVISKEEISISLKVSVTCLLDVFVPKYEAIHMEELSIYDHEWNDHYVAAQIEKKIWFEVNLITDNKYQEILGFDIEADENLNNEDYSNFENNS